MQTQKRARIFLPKHIEAVLLRSDAHNKLSAEIQKYASDELDLQEAVRNRKLKPQAMIVSKTNGSLNFIPSFTKIYSDASGDKVLNVFFDKNEKIKILLDASTETADEYIEAFGKRFTFNPPDCELCFDCGIECSDKRDRWPIRAVDEPVECCTTCYQKYLDAKKDVFRKFYGREYDESIDTPEVREIIKGKAREHYTVHKVNFSENDDMLAISWLKKDEGDLEYEAFMAWSGRHAEFHAQRMIVLDEEARKVADELIEHENQERLSEALSDAVTLSRENSSEIILPKEAKALFPTIDPYPTSCRNSAGITMQPSVHLVNKWEAVMDDHEAKYPGFRKGYKKYLKGKK
jgi:hypothetical protein